MNIHTPERQQGESFFAYQRRRAESNLIGRKMQTVGRGGVSSRKQFRDSMRASGTMGKRTRAYVALMAAWASKRVTKAKLRDENGAYTLVGRGKPSSHAFASLMSLRRMWLAGISAQRGY